MHQSITKERLFELFSALAPSQQSTVLLYIDSLLKAESAVQKRDKSALLSLSTWDDSDIHAIEEAQDRINE